MAKKLQLVTEESYRDPANIHLKRKKHQAFKAELTGNTNRIQASEDVAISGSPENRAVSAVHWIESDYMLADQVIPRMSKLKELAVPTTTRYEEPNWQLFMDFLDKYSVGFHQLTSALKTFSDGAIGRGIPSQLQNQDSCLNC